MEAGGVGSGESRVSCGGEWEKDQRMLCVVSVFHVFIALYLPLHLPIHLCVAIVIDSLLFLCKYDFYYDLPKRSSHCARHFFFF